MAGWPVGRRASWLAGSSERNLFTSGPCFIKKEIKLELTLISRACSCLWRVVDLKKTCLWKRKSPDDLLKFKIKRVTAAEAENSRRDMQSRLILVSNGCNFDMFTDLQRSASGSRPVPVHDQFWFTPIPVRTNSSSHGSG